MTNLYGLAGATLNPVLCTLLTLYGTFIGMNFIIIIYSIGIRRILPREFLIYGLITTTLVLLGLSVVTYFVMTINYDCTLGFLTYDFYQIKEVFRKTKAGKNERIVFYCLLALRAASLIYNLYYIQGIIADPTTTGSFIGAGPCKTLSTDTMVHQEHIYIIFFEFVIIARIVKYALSLDKNRSWKRFYRVIDFEILTFMVYLLCEVIYMAFYLTFPPSDISYFNVFYNQISVFLFAVNATNFSAQKIDKAAELEAKAGDQAQQKSVTSMFFKSMSRKKKTSEAK
ncbi:hypothetical protein HDV06_003419 [Boothiomyces sp. JEL0866]|nr:hypothetical protein HDV06_003371 [Boothiomyces sp. JEL0866]KAJ3325649.1 hypothetical protein HDV06_003419 [Boothiomyces sp. JEL0866]